jgi:hypothetical protein
MRGDVLPIYSVDDPNWPIALEVLQEGGYIAYQGVGLTLRDYSATGRIKPAPDTPLTARMATQWQTENLTEARALADLSHAEAVLEALIADSPEIAKLVDDRGLRFELLDDYGTGAILIAIASSGRVDWLSTPWTRETSTRLQGYRLSRVVESPEALVLDLQEPRGKAPMRVRLVAPWDLKARVSVLPEGLLIDRTVWQPDAGKGESFTMYFADRRFMLAKCRQVIFDVS